MTDIRCPNCGQSNPAGATTCKKCKASLGATGEQDWLTRLGPDTGNLAPDPSATGESPLQQANEPADAESTDWLARIRERSRAENAISPFGPNPLDRIEAESSDVPDWLKDLSGDSDAPSAASPATNSGAIGGNSGPAASGSRPSASQPTSPTSPASSSSSASDWLNDFRSEGSLSSDSETIDAGPDASSPFFNWDNPSAPAAPQAASSDQAPAGGFSDWFNQPIEPPSTAPSTPSSSKPDPSGDVPDWLQDFKDGSAAASLPSTPAPASAAPGSNSWTGSSWFDSTPPAQPPAASASAASPAPAENLPDWMKVMDDWKPMPAEQEEAPSVSDDDLPKWSLRFPEQYAAQDTPSLQGAPAEEPPSAMPGEQLAGQPSAQPAGQLPAKPEEKPQPAAPAAPRPKGAFFDDVPDWLADKTPPMETPAAGPAPKYQRPAPEQPSTAPANEIGLPDWLSFGSAAQPAAQSTGQAPMDAGPASGFSVPASPDQGAPAAKGPESLSPFAGSDEGLDWLSAIPTEEPQPSSQPFEAAPPSSTFIGGLPIDETSLPSETAAGLPDWLSFVGPETASPAQPQPSAPAFLIEDNGSLSTTSPVSDQPFSAGDIPDWLQDADVEETPQPSPSVAAQPTRPAAVSPEPASSPGEQSAPAPAVAGSAAADNLSPAQLPGWLQAMRPLEAVAPVAASKVDDHRIESAGPLAGLQGVLPGEDLARRYRKPPAYSVKLRISEKQRTYMTQLEQLVSDETTAQDVKPVAPWSPQWMVRAALAVLLILAIVFSVPPSSVPAPSLEMMNLSNQIEKLPDGAPVLLAVDYDPGYAGEMRLASTGLIQRLMVHRARIALVSTVPAGPVLGQELLRSAAQDARSQSLPGGDYALDSRVINLGYLPGGLTSLQEFASQPQLATRYGFASDPDTSAWSQAQLQGVESLRSFAAVVVLTDSGDTGRAWVEQVQPLLGEVPLYMVSTAQAAPMLRPYADGGQVKGLIAGLDGGVIYQQLAQGSTGNLFAWGAYRSGLFLGIVFILLGILLKIMLTALPRRKA
jgi:hypothetical protein